MCGFPSKESRMESANATNLDLNSGRKRRRSGLGALNARF
jgi:hypothetical protein